MAQQQLMTVNCDPECGFSVTDHNKSELKKIVKDHSEITHNKSVSDSEVERLIKYN